MGFCQLVTAKKTKYKGCFLQRKRVDQSGHM